MRKREQNRLVKILEKHGTVTVFREDEDIDYVGNCSAVDPEADAQQEQWIREQLESGNAWAWCYVRVVVSYGRFRGSDALGMCSYLSEEDFRAGGYFEDLVHAACLEIVATLAAAGETIESLKRLKV